MTSVRANPGTTALTQISPSALSTLNNISLNDLNVVKELTFSHVDDLTLLVGDIPADVEVVGFSAEGGLMPNADWTSFQSDPVTAITNFRTALNTGTVKRRLSYATTGTVFDNQITNDDMASIVPLIDIAAWQGQSTYRNSGEDTFVSTVKTYWQYVKSRKPSCLFNVQLFLSDVNQTAAESISGFNRSRGYCDFGVIGGAGADDVNTILQGLAG